jgi:hypothetical protein
MPSSAWACEARRTCRRRRRHATQNRDASKGAASKRTQLNTALGVFAPWREAFFWQSQHRPLAGREKRQRRRESTLAIRLPHAKALKFASGARQKPPREGKQLSIVELPLHTRAPKSQVFQIPISSPRNDLRKPNRFEFGHLFLSASRAYDWIRVINTCSHIERPARRASLGLREPQIDADGRRSDSHSAFISVNLRLLCSFYDLGEGMSSIRWSRWPLATLAVYSPSLIPQSKIRNPQSAIPYPPTGGNMSPKMHFCDKTFATKPHESRYRLLPSASCLLSLTPNRPTPSSR